MGSDQVVHRIHRMPGESGSANRQKPRDIGAGEDSQGHTTEDQVGGTLLQAPWPLAMSSHCYRLTLLNKHALALRA